MGRPPKKRPPSVEAFWSEAAKKWLAFVNVKDAQGKTERRIKRSCNIPGPVGKEKCEDLVREVDVELAEKEARRAANVQPKGGTYGLHAWLRYWLAEIVFPRVSYNTFRDYKLVVEHDILPNIEDVDLPDLAETHIEEMLKKLRTSGSTDKPQRAYIRLRMALKAAAARPKTTGLWHNPILAVDKPKHTSPEVTPFTLEQTKKILSIAKGRRNRARWTCALALGLRPGEVRALVRAEDFYLVYVKAGERVPERLWYEVDLDTVCGVLVVDQNAYRRKWLHGCEDPHNCGKKYHRYPCPNTGARHDRYHKRGCPTYRKYCAPGCVEHAKACEHRHGGLGPDGEQMPGGQVFKDPKSEAGRRKRYLSKPITRELLEHLREQDKERIKAGDLWIGSGALFATKRGGLLNEREDWGEFQSILAEAGLAKQRPYDGRHFAATMLLLKKVDKRLVMDAMGWSTEAMAKRYQHVLDEMRMEATDAVSELLFDDEPGSATPPATPNITDLDEWRRKRS